MAVRFTSDTQGYSTVTLPPTTGVPYTITWWGYISVNKGAVAAAMLELSAAGGIYVISQFYNGLTNEISIQTGGNDDNFIAVLGQWYCFALTQSETGGLGTMNIFWGTDPRLLSSRTRNGNPSATTKLNIGKQENTVNTFLDGRIASFKQWDRVLSIGEISAELAQYQQVSSIGLIRRHDFLTATIISDGGSGGNLTAGTVSPTVEAGPTLLNSAPPLIFGVDNSDAMSLMGVY